jgi:hypothetical protein
MPLFNSGPNAWWRWSAYRRNAVNTPQQVAYAEGVAAADQGQTSRRRGAYRAGERDGQRIEARRHRGHPVLATLLVLVALAGVGYGYLSWQEGSFAAAGAVIDAKIAEVRGAASQAGVVGGQAVQNAGADIAKKSQAIAQPAPSSPSQSSGG